MRTRAGSVNNAGPRLGAYEILALLGTSCRVRTAARMVILAEHSHRSFKKLGCKRLRTYTPPAHVAYIAGVSNAGVPTLVCSTWLLVELRLLERRIYAVHQRSRGRIGFCPHSPRLRGLSDSPSRANDKRI